MKHALLSLFASTLVTFLVVRFDHLHAHLSADNDLAGVQKFHTRPVPRVGGVGIFIGLLLTWLVLLEDHMLTSALLFMLPASLVFAVGLTEDITKQVSVTVRLVVTMFAALVGCFTLDMTVRTFGVPFIDTLFQINLVAFMFTVVAVAGVSNAINLIDGFNGLSGFVSITVLVALAVVAYFVGDEFVFTVALASAGAVTGFLAWNYPFGKIFLGDGGAYFIGFVIAELSILLHERNEQVSVLFPLLVVIYPVFETVFSIYRRKFVRGQSPGAPDAMHLHQLINKRLVRWRSKNISGPVRSRGNSLTSPYLWLLNLLAAIPAVVFWNNTPVLAGFIALFIATYLRIYASIVRFRTTTWPIIPRRAS